MNCNHSNVNETVYTNQFGETFIETECVDCGFVEGRPHPGYFP